MLNPVKAREELGKIRSAKHQEARFNRVKKLPPAVCTVAMNLVSRQADGKPLTGDYRINMALREKAGKTLHDKPKVRAQVLKAFFPTLADEIEAAWQLFARLPYTFGYERRAFRAPNLPGAYVSRRKDFLLAVINSLDTFPEDAVSIEWVAAWAIHLDDTDDLGYLLAGAIDKGKSVGESVFEILKDSAGGQHDIGGMGGHIPRALLCCSKPAAWEFMEKLLLAAQRQEGLRQSILEAVDEAHPQAFPRMVNLLLRENLIRFSSVARAAAVWLGEEESSLAPKKLKDDLTQLQEFLTDPKSVQQAIAKGDAHATYRGLWAMALTDVQEAVKAAAPILKDKTLGRRYAAARFLKQTGMPGVGELFLPLLEDKELPIVSITLDYYHYPTVVGADDDSEDKPNHPGRPDELFERLEKLIPKLPEKEKELKPVAAGWEEHAISQENAANLLSVCLGKRPPERLIPYMKQMDEFEHIRAIALLTEKRTITSQVQELLLAIAGHPSGGIRGAALKALEKCKLAEDEAQTLEGYLTRKTADFRQGVLGLLLGRPDKPVLSSIDRLLAGKDANQRVAGIELARQMIGKKRQADAARDKLIAYRDEKGKRLPKAEAETIEHLLNPASAPASLEDGLGLMNQDELTTGTTPKRQKIKLATPAAVELIKSLDAFIHANKDKTFTYETWRKDKIEAVIGSVNHYSFPTPDIKKSPADDRANLPLAEMWDEWWAGLSSKCRDEDGLELIRAVAMELAFIREGEEEAEPDDFMFDDDDNDEDLLDSNKGMAAAIEKAAKELRPLPPVKVHYEIIRRILEWMVKLHPAPKTADFYLQAVEHSLAIVPPEVLAHIPKEHDWQDRDWRSGSSFTRWLSLTREFRSKKSADWTKDHDARLYKLLRWMDQPHSEAKHCRCEPDELLAGYEAGAASVADFVDHLIGKRGLSRGWGDESFDLLREVTPADGKLPPIIEAHPELRDMAAKVRDRILEIELTRGETPTAATTPAKEIVSVHGAELLFRIIRALGKQPFAKTSYGVADSKPAILTNLIRRSYPLPTDTPESFAALAKAGIAAGEVTDERILNLAMLNPRWLSFVEHTLKWPGFSEAVWWFIAHTANSWSNAFENDDDDDMDEDDDDSPASETPKEKPKSAWAEILKARTNLTAEQRADGVIDVQWFHLAYAAVGSAKRWDAIEEAAKFLGYGQGHKKAERLADVLLGKTKKKELVDGIRKKNLKEFVKLLGLLPLPTDEVKREAELLDRHKVLMDYERYARGLSSLSKEPAMAAARLGLENLSVTAGYGDPMRLEWAVGAKQVSDLLEGPVTLNVKNVAVTLTLTGEAIPEISQTRDGKPLKSIPPDVKKLPKVTDLVERAKGLKRMSSSTKRSLEQAMCAGDEFTTVELRQLMGHALVKPLLTRLVLQSGDVRGYPVNGGKALRDHTGKNVPLKADQTWMIAHPLDLLAAGDWPEWQAECFKSERVQPFKQVFREVYTLTPSEKEEGHQSTRFAGQQLNPQQSTALFSSRGWSTREGTDKLFRRDNLVASVNFDHGYTTPAEVEGLTFSSVEFHRRGDWKKLPLAEIPAKIFSEVMRDLDLVVSVAHVGGIDPEASQSTVEMRQTLLKETCSLLKIANVRYESKHAFIKGELGNYSVHLGSGTVHKQPGGSLCVVPVHSQHRGRLFLPFADDDPRTAEVVSKVLMLARDQEIQDPTILSQIAGR
ncbi:DUF5724 domain-containing protein [Zavarzinella formosa]|uniref:DUF5724 domain-containing protein n=1 Tax=Zavarzinella formosa TaxID=360055 RepID=UPI00031D225B|nr:DUF5724 domain-containing protein [Zavarzinella formosa]